MRSFTYDDGASSIGVSSPPPGLRAGTGVPAWSAIQFAQSFHHDPSWNTAPLSQASGLSGSSSLVQYPYFFEVGGLMTPATCPDAPSTNRLGPDSSRVPA